MSQTDPTQPRGAIYTRPYGQLVVMSATLVMVATIGALLFTPIIEIFNANPWLNGLIVIVFLVGVAACFWQALRIVPAATWAERFAARREGLTEPPQLLASMSAMLSEGQSREALTPTAARSVIDAVYGRVSESRDLARYIAGLLIFLGLLGTFWGLARTIPALVDTIRALTPQPGEETLDAFARLSAGFERQLAAMGTAFSSSLAGLAGSLIVGLLDLLSGHAQNRFLREFEDWVASVTRIDLEVTGAPVAAGAPQGPTESELRRLVQENAQQITSLLTTLKLDSGSRRESVRKRVTALENRLKDMGSKQKIDPKALAELQQDLSDLRADLRESTRKRPPS